MSVFDVSAPNYTAFATSVDYKTFGGEMLNEKTVYFYGNTILRDSDTNEVVAIYESCPVELQKTVYDNVAIGIDEITEKLCSVSSLRGAEHRSRACLVSGNSFFWGHQFDTRKSGVAKTPWNYRTDDCCDFDFFLTSFAEKNIWPAYQRIDKETAQAHLTSVLSYKPCSVIGNTPFTNCTVNVTTELLIHKDVGDWKGTVDVKNLLIVCRRWLLSCNMFSFASLF
jgi:hypothetical protein